MFDAEQLACVDPEYFNVILMDPYDVSIQSKNTGHYWLIHSCGYPHEGSCIIYHKHKYQHPLHQHSRANTLRKAVRDIKGHDRWQMNGRKHAAGDR